MRTTWPQNFEPPGHGGDGCLLVPFSLHRSRKLDHGIVPLQQEETHVDLWVCLSTEAVLLLANESVVSSAPPTVTRAALDSMLQVRRHHLTITAGSQPQPSVQCPRPLVNTTRHDTTTQAASFTETRFPVRFMLCNGEGLCGWTRRAA